MINIKEINREYLISIVFGITGLLLSLIAGIFSGNSVALISLRAVIGAVIFSMLGFGCVFVIKKFVPELYQILNLDGSINEQININATDSGDGIDTNTAVNGSASDISGGDLSDQESGTNSLREDSELESQFSTLDKPAFEERGLADMGSNDLNRSLRESSKDKGIKYEPKIAAQAIRTMMKRDE